jgi:hypothetical protein
MTEAGRSISSEVPSAPSNLSGSDVPGVNPPARTERNRLPPREGRAHSFRQRQSVRRSARKELVGEILVAAILVLSVYVVVTARPFFPSSSAGIPGTPGPPGSQITVTLATPKVGNVTCGGGGTAYTERILWVNSSYPVTTADLYLVLYEIWDGDNIADGSAMANVTSSSLCAGAAPTSLQMWYLVLVAANGTNLLTYTEPHSWASVGHTSTNIAVENGWALDVVTYASIAGTGRGLKVEGSVGSSPIYGAIPL